MVTPIIIPDYSDHHGGRNVLAEIENGVDAGKALERRMEGLSGYDTLDDKLTSVLSFHHVEQAERELQTEAGFWRIYRRKYNIGDSSFHPAGDAIAVYVHSTGNEQGNVGYMFTQGIITERYAQEDTDRMAYNAKLITSHLIERLVSRREAITHSVITKAYQIGLTAAPLAAAAILASPTARNSAFILFPLVAAAGASTLMLLEIYDNKDYRKSVLNLLERMSLPAYNAYYGRDAAQNLIGELEAKGALPAANAVTS